MSCFHSIFFDKTRLSFGTILIAAPPRHHVDAGLCSAYAWGLCSAYAWRLCSAYFQFFDCSEQNPEHIEQDALFAEHPSELLFFVLRTPNASIGWSRAPTLRVIRRCVLRICTVSMLSLPRICRFRHILLPALCNNISCLPCRLYSYMSCLSL